MTNDEQYRLSVAMFEIGKLIGAELDPGTLLARIAEQIGAVVNAGACSVMLLDNERKRLLAKAAYEPLVDRSHALSFRVGEGIAGWVVLHGKPVLIHDVAEDPRFIQPPVANPTSASIAAMVCAPMIARAARVGVVTATSPTAGAFDDGHLDTVRFIAQTIAVDIENVRVHRVALTDHLTGAYIREFLLECLPREIANASEHDRPLSVAMVDLDHFGDLNDHHGRLAGDTVLAEVARRLRAAIRTGDVLVRYDGEQFFAVLPRADAGRAWEVGERMRQRVSERAFDLGGGVALILRISVGVAQWRTGEAMRDLIQRVDSALFSAKDRGRNRVEVAP